MHYDLSVIKNSPLSFLPKGKKIVVTGGAGFIGSVLSNFLALENEVIAIDNLESGDWSRCSGDYEKIEMDLSSCDNSDLHEIMHKSDILCHLAAVKLHNSANSVEKIISTNIEATSRLFEAAGSENVGRVLFTSSLYANGSMGPEIISENDRESPRTVYGASKLFGEHLLRSTAEKYGFSYVIPRLFFIYGPNQFASGGYKSVIVKNYERILNGSPAIVNGDGSQVLDYLFLDDCIASLVGLLSVDFQGVVNVGSGIGYSIIDLVEKMVKVAGGLQLQFAPPDWTAGSTRIANPSLLESLVDFRPQTNIERGLEVTWNSLQKDPK